jgi:hypothetical protein
MVKSHKGKGVGTEQLVAELAAAAYGVALRHGLKGPFIDVELDLWRALREVLGDRPSGGRAAATTLDS